jgi:hypothetical protein
MVNLHRFSSSQQGRDNHEWTIQRHCQHWAQKTQDEVNENKKNNRKQKTKKMKHKIGVGMMVAI